MNGFSLRLCGMMCILLSTSLLLAQQDIHPLMEMQNPQTLEAVTTTKQVTVAGSHESITGMVVSIEKGNEGYPGIKFKQDPALDLSEYGYVAAKITNLGETKIFVAMRIDNAGDWRKNPWNTENLYLAPGKTGIALVRFGYSYGKPAYKLDASKITQIMLFTGKIQNDAGAQFRIESIYAGGKPGEKPPVKPENVRIVPKDGIILGKDIKIDPAKQFFLRDAKVDMQGSQLVVDITSDKSNAMASYKPPVGMWNLNKYLQLAVTVKNTGKTPLTPQFCVLTKGGDTDWAKADKALAPGQSTTVTVPFIKEDIWNGDDPKKSGTRMTSHAVRAINIATTDPKAGQQLTVESMTAQLITADIPSWLGKRPPVEGQWTQTLNDDFDSSVLNEKLWRIYAPNYWDKRSHFSKDNVVLGDGMVRLRMEKKTGPHNDDPKSEKVTDYAVGFMDSYGKWTQKYGYFEARMKLPTAPGLWPAFWMMPDRGEDKGPQWVRQDTAKGGMEFDIMEHLTRWGPYRYNVAMHWDGYKKDHKSIGSSSIYAKPDKDGFITAGVLWLPGKLVYYAQGQEVARWENQRVCDQPMDLMFDLVTGGWDNDPLDDEQLPADFVIDYVRAWQRNDLASDADGFKQP
jgi:beta-glucanase (GH16 family)